MFPMPNSDYTQFTFKLVLALISGLLIAGLL
jgi:hypothetical protein